MEMEEDIWDYKCVGQRKRPRNNGEDGSLPTAESTRRGKAERRGGSRRAADPALRSRRIRSRRKRGSNRHTGAEDQDSLSPRPLSPSASNAHDQATPSTIAPSTPLKQSKNSDGKYTPRNSKPVHAGHCPICQMPFSLLLIETPRWHVAECLETPGCTDNECPDGLLCNNTIPRHYKRYSHLLLAENRALSQNDTQSTFCSVLEKDTLTTSPDFNNNDQSLQGSQSLQIKESLTSKKQNALLLLKSPNSKVVTQNSSKFKFVKGASEILASGSVSKEIVSASSSSNLHRRLHCSASQLTTEVKPGNNIDGLFKEATINNTPKELKSLSDDESAFALPSKTNCDDNISYSPLSSDDEIPNQNSRCYPRKQLFQDQTINHCYNSENAMFFDLKQLQSIKQELRCKSGVTKDIVMADVYALGIGPDSAILTDSVNTSTANGKEGETQLPQLKSEPSAYKWFPLDNGNNKELYNQFESNLIGSALIELKTEDSNSISLLPQIKEEPSASYFTQCVAAEEPFDYQNRKEKKGNSRCPMETALADAQDFVLPMMNMEKPGSILKHVNSPKSRTKSFAIESQSLLGKSSINTPKRTVIKKELKQTDIGVFFGLPPKVEDEKQSPKNTPPGKAIELFSEVSYVAKRQRQRKRKIDSSVSDEACLGNVEKKQMEPIDEQQRRTKRQREINPYRKNKQCPFYKKIPGTNFTVDAFQYGVIEGCTGYFLTHFHSDHYGGLTKKFGCLIYCNTITRNLVISKLKVQDQCVISLPMNTECIVDGVKVVLLDANHCPGAAMLLFQLPNGKTILHTGDFRANSSMERYSHLMDQKIHVLYLDTTYCSPEYTFPSQQEAIQFVGNIAFETVAMNPRTLIVCGTYSIGKEKVFLAIAQVLGCKVCITKNKLDILRCLNSEQIDSVVTLDWQSTQVHLLPMMQITFKGLQAHMNKFPGQYDQIVAFKPTGWTYSSQRGPVLNIKPRVQGRIAIYGVPYSEHSSYLEMKRFVQWVKPDKIIPTVNNGSWQERNVMEKIFNEWMIESV
ncbi:DNA cross-link repair 1A protein [Leucoraja erinacea]|uniref:DNA cross-link repair 1A protein n=1 Tax=Leucoraja erinaceus TaxID=7782 RepID=UPI002456822F|nr:DNA cross-link repair 1A protein [Leucoraja erinacea]